MLSGLAGAGRGQLMKMYCSISADGIFSTLWRINIKLKRLLLLLSFTLCIQIL